DPGIGEDLREHPELGVDVQRLQREHQRERDRGGRAQQRAADLAARRRGREVVPGAGQHHRPEDHRHHDHHPPHPQGVRPSVGAEAAAPPRARATLYSVIRPTVRAPPCSLIQAGTSTLPSAGPTRPSTESSTNTANVPAEGRSSSPSATATKEATIVPVSPMLRESGTASSPATPKISGGNAVSRPEAKAPWP